MADIFSIMDNSGKIIQSAPSPVKIDGLSGNTTYSGMTAVRNYGTDKLEIPDQLTTPSAPSIEVTPGDSVIGMTISKGSGDGESAITGANIQFKQTTDSDWSNATVDATLKKQLTGLINGAEYQIKAQLINASGNGDFSDQLSATPKATVKVPGAPTVTATAGDSKINVSVTDPSDNGGSPITDRLVYWTDGTNTGTVDLKTETSGSITGLTNGTSYTIQSTVKNSAGESSKSKEVTASPVAPTVPVSSVTADAALSVKVGDTVKINVSVDPANATDKAFTVTSKDPTVATVTSDGTATGVKAGTVEIDTVSHADPTKTAKTTLTVTEQ